MPRSSFYFLAAIAMLLTGCGKTYRYKMTVEVETPQGLKTGSAVREIVYSESIVKLPDAPGASARQRGEAVAVDLPDGKTLFALLDMNAYVTLQTGFGGDSASILDAATADRRISVVKPFPPTLGTSPSDPSNYFKGYPQLIKFADIADPMSVKKVRPDNLAASFGPGVTLMRITIQMTDEALTSKIENRLPWLQNTDRYRTDPSNPFTNTLPEEVGFLKAG